MGIDPARCPTSLRDAILAAEKRQERRRKRVLKQQPRSEGEETLALALRAHGIEGRVREYRFHRTRKYRFDFAWPQCLFAVEVQGGVRDMGRHQRRKGFTRDCEKTAEAVAMGWRVMTVTARHVKSGEALSWIRSALSFLESDHFEGVPSGET